MAELQTIIQRIPIAAGTSEVEQLDTLKLLRGLVREQGRVIGGVQSAKIDGSHYVVELRLDVSTPAGSQILKWASGGHQNFALKE